MMMASVGLGAWYLWWRWSYSINPEAYVFSVSVAAAETCAYLGLVLFTYNLWATRDTPPQRAPETVDQVSPGKPVRPISVDVFLPTFNEDPELTRYSIRDAMALRYPYPIEIKVHILDDGNRLTMAKVAQEEGANYITRFNNVGYKAGNLRNGMEQTRGDFIVILDSDTRAFPTLLENTLGYFRDPDVAWVQTPQWFYDVPAGQPLDQVLESRFGRTAGAFGRQFQRLTGEIRLGQDPFVSSPKLFYDVIQRRRNRVNASFCCGAGSIHRRSAVMQAAVLSYSHAVSDSVSQYSDKIQDAAEQAEVQSALRSEIRQATEVTPYKFHVSEDIYTSILIQSDPNRRWKSVLHPGVETKMLSPLDLQSWAMQRYKYAGGTLDIIWNDNPLFRHGLSVPQKLMYCATFWSYLAPLWNVIFLAAPIIALTTGMSPVEAYSSEFFLHLLPFLICHELASTAATWGVDNRKGKMLNLAFFSLNLQAMWAVLRGREIKFEVTPKARKDDLFLSIVYPQIAVVGLTLGAIAFAGSQILITQDQQALGTFVVNTFWGLSNAWAMCVLIFAAFWRPEKENRNRFDVKNRLRTV
ncbi:cellulose synthase [Rhodobacteraceae bacterium (ex Bugula neritina AB1)]|nr:cellulose synthase [Rhodobacteraceae bacterium (ex Bugula neritina AB1)]